MKKWIAKIAMVLVTLAVPDAIALDQRESTVLRTVRGTVVDARGRPLPSSVVYLHRQKTHEVRTHIADGNGQYRFSGLHSHADYEIHAKHGNSISSVHKLYATDRKRDVTLDLKVDKKQRSTPFLPGDFVNGNMIARILDDSWSTTGAVRNCDSTREAFFAWRARHS